MATDATPAEKFFSDFLIPLLYGQEVTIGLPISKDTWAELCADVETRSARVDRIDIALQIRLAELMADPPLISFDMELLKLAVGMYQLLFGFHAAAEQGRVSEGRLDALAEDTARLLSTVGDPDNRAEVLARHVVLDGFFLLYRKDVQIFFRLGAKQFFGEEVEWLRLPFRWRVQYEEVMGTDIATGIYARHTGRAFEQLQRLSPLTRILRADRLYDAFDFRGLQSVLMDPVLCRLVVNQLVDRGLGQFMPALGVGFRRLVQQGEKPSWIIYVARFLATLLTSQVFFRPDDSARSLLDARYRPPTDAMKFEAPEVSGEEEETGNTYQALRERDGLLGWSILAALAEQNEVLRVPELSELKPDVTSLFGQLSRAEDNGLPLASGRELVSAGLSSVRAGH